MVGISVDNPGQNKAMVEKPGLPFPAEAMTKVYDRSWPHQPLTVTQ